MIETNVRVLEPGRNIAVPVRYIQVRGTTNTPELREKICYRLRQEYGLTAVPCQDRRERLLVVTAVPLPLRELHIDEWKLSLSDAGEAKVLTLTNDEGWLLLPKLIERMMTDTIERRGIWWSFDSLRHWYEQQPFAVGERIDALRRYAVSALPIEGVGIGVAIDVETAFFTQDNVAYFFDTSQSPRERERRRVLFEQLTLRQRGQKGTLLYYNGHTSLKCYFERFLVGKTCGNTPPRKIRGREYRSLVQYYKEVSPDLDVRPSDPVAMVSFPGLDYPQPVAAHCLKLRVMNEMLPTTLITVDKIAPTERKRMIEAFWQALGLVSFPQIWGADRDSTMSLQAGARFDPSGEHPSQRGRTISSKETELPSLFSSAPVALSNDGNETGTIQDKCDREAFGIGFWRPETQRIRQIPFPTLQFANGAVLESPIPIRKETYKRHFLRRSEILDTQGGYYFWPLMKRALVCAYPEEAGLCEAAQDMMDEICHWLKQWTGKPFEWRPLPYASVNAAVTELSEERSA